MTTGPFKALQDALKLNPAVGAFVAGGYIVMAMAIVLLGLMGEAATGISPLLLVIYLLGFSLVVLVLTQLPAVLRTLLAWVMVVLFGLWMIAVFAQLVTGGNAPGIAPLSCLVNPLGQVCTEYEAGAGGFGPEREDRSGEPGVGRTTDGVAAAPDEPGPTVPVVGESRARVYVLFAGSMDRPDIYELSQSLEAAGWDVLNPMDPASNARGGDRQEAVKRQMEVRFFHSEDADLARSLAAEVTAWLPENQIVTAEPSDPDDSWRPEDARAHGYLEVRINPPWAT